MATYKIPAEAGKLNVSIEWKLDEAPKSWTIHTTHVVVELTQEHPELETEEAKKAGVERLD